ncbi:hypothetical protein O181_055242 [Austropuccinia psidii MF-1]|uniref:SH3 domain-containing protein n=1 Tax=Austropuccinia psidii MF-1 TaxID=1389203 RepID=A0A9Q3E8G3_9BASI|nr:hypothetical protein [Austropuccinia psidii MF-1]
MNLVTLTQPNFKNSQTLIFKNLNSFDNFDSSPSNSSVSTASATNRLDVFQQQSLSSRSRLVTLDRSVAPFPSPSGTFLPPPQLGGNWNLPAVEEIFRDRKKMTSTMVRPSSTSILSNSLSTLDPLQASSGSLSNSLSLSSSLIQSIHLKRTSAPHSITPPNRPPSTSQEALANSQSEFVNHVFFQSSLVSQPPKVRDFAFALDDPRHSGRIQADLNPIKINQNTNINSRSGDIQSKFFNQLSSSSSSSSSQLHHTGSDILSKDENSETDQGEFYIALYDFKSEGENEIDLVEGEIVKVLEIICDGWVIAKQVSGILIEDETEENGYKFNEDESFTGLIGLCPENYLMKVSTNSKA